MYVIGDEVRDADGRRGVVVEVQRGGMVVVCLDASKTPHTFMDWEIEHIDINVRRMARALEQGPEPEHRPVKAQGVMSKVCE